jgi:hypothetical protein
MKRPAAWYRKANASQRANDVEYLKESVRLLRKFYTGFDAKHGYDLHRHSVAAFSPKKVERIRKLSRQIRVEMSADYTILRPRTEAQRVALEKHTGVPRERGRKAYIVHVPNKKTTAKLRQRGDVASVVEITKRTGAESKREYFYFRDYQRGGQPKTMKGILARARKMLKDMPAGFYVFVSRDYGYIGAAMHRDKLLEELDRVWLDYDRFKPGANDSRGLASSIVGFARVSTEIEGAEREYIERMTRRMQYQRSKRREYERKQDRLRRLITGRR